MKNHSTSRRRGKVKGRKTKKEKQTYESSNLNISGSWSLAAAASPDVSFLMEVLEEATSPTRFLFFSKFSVVRVSRGRQHSRVTLFSRIFGIISVLAFVSLGGFRTSRCKISLDCPSSGR
jgi:hypothetical protein